MFLRILTILLISTVSLNLFSQDKEFFAYNSREEQTSLNNLNTSEANNPNNTNNSGNDSYVKSFKFYYRIGMSLAELNYRTNSATLDSLKKLICSVPEGNLLKLELRASASPDGAHKNNVALSAKRLKNIEKQLRGLCTLPKDMVIERINDEIAYEELKKMVLSSNMKDKNAIVDIIDNVPQYIFDNNGKIIGGKKQSLMNLKGGVPYNYMFKHFFPNLRQSVAVTVYIGKPMFGSSKSSEYGLDNETYQPAPEETINRVDGAKLEPIGYSPIDPYFNEIPVNLKVERAAPQGTPKPSIELRPAEVHPEVTAPQMYRYTPLFALKTNLLFDLALTPNIELEVPIGKRWSVNGEFMRGWWLNKSNTFCWQVESFGLEGRY